MLREAVALPSSLTLRLQKEPAMALAALVAVLNLAVLTHRPGGRLLFGPALAWRASAGAPAERNEADKPAANPVRTYNVGQLALNTGIAVFALTVWLQVMRINGANGR